MLLTLIIGEKYDEAEALGKDWLAGTPPVEVIGALARIAGLLLATCAELGGGTKDELLRELALLVAEDPSL